MKRIKKNLLFLFFILLIMPFTIKTVSAATTCSELKEKVDKYNTLYSQMESLNCSEASESSIVNECNSINIQKNIVLTDLFEINSLDLDCDTAELKTIINDNKRVCTNELSSKINSLAKRTTSIFYVIGTLLFIIFGSLDFLKNIVGSDQKELNNNRKNFFKRLTALMLLYLLPVFINLIFSFLPLHYRLGTNKYSCNIKSYQIYTENVVSGYYSKSRIGMSVSTKGQAIAEAAKEIKAEAVKNNYSYGCNFLSAADQGTKKTNVMCCAEIIGAALLRAEIYSKSEVKQIHTASAPTVTRNLVAKGWVAIWNERDLQPGDVLVYQKLTALDGCGTATIDGKTYHVPHVAIFYGRDKKDGTPKIINTGGSFGEVVSNFYSGEFTTSGGKAKWLCGLRYVGK